MDKDKAEVYKVMGDVIGKFLSNLVGNFCKVIVVLAVCGGWLWVIYILWKNPNWPTGIAATGAPAALYLLVKGLFSHSKK